MSVALREISDMEVIRMNEKYAAEYGIEAVITSYNQGDMILEAVDSLCRQTVPPSRIIIVDDGSTDEGSLSILSRVESDLDREIPAVILRQKNRGVSAARNAGICKADSEMVLVLDGDDRLEPSYLEEVGNMLHRDPSLVAASSWMRTFGVLSAEIRPAGGRIEAFLSRNCCPATHILRREAWEQCGGYDETMRSGFEDWDFFLSMLETRADAAIGIVERALVDYRTAPASSNVKSMEKRLELMRFIIEKHSSAYQEHIADALLGIESVSMSRLYGWESEIAHAIEEGRGLCEASEGFMVHPSYGDGGMAAAVRIVSAPAGTGEHRCAGKMMNEPEEGNTDI